MACVENMPPGNGDSEREEGEIVDDYDDLSEISSEEEFLLRQRLLVLENYNNVLERKNAKQSSFVLGKRKKREVLFERAQVSKTNFEVVHSPTVYRDTRDQKHSRTCYRQKRRKEIESYSHSGKNKDPKKKTHRSKKTAISESSEESDDEYKNKRRKLQNAVAVNKDKSDSSSLRARLNKMLCGEHCQENVQTQEHLQVLEEKTIIVDDNQCKNKSFDKLEDPSTDSLIIIDNPCKDVKDNTIGAEISKENQTEASELIDLCADDDVKPFIAEKQIDTIDSVMEVSEEKNNAQGDSDEDLELLRQYALKTKADSDEDLESLRQHALKTKSSQIKTNQLDVPNESENKPMIQSEDEDSDTAELRMICLKSAILKKAIEMKQKQKLKKRLSQSSLQDELMAELNEFTSNVDTENNTDTESVDMDIGSDADEKEKETLNSSETINDMDKDNLEDNNAEQVLVTSNVSKEDELEEDEDLLRAKLLTSLSKNLPNLVDPNILNTVDKENIKDKSLPVNKANLPEPKRFIINLGESDSEGEHEATKNLTKMHIKLSEQVDFQQKLDLFLKSTRMEVEKTKLPDVVQDPSSLPKPAEKFVAKAVNHLPKSEQIEYKNLVKRMAELEKIKQARQSSMDLVNGPSLHIKDTLKPRNISIDSMKMVSISNLEEQIALSRKNIAEESAKMLKLKEEASKLSQKYKIVATELHNISTAITLNKREQRSAQIRLSKIRTQHQRLLSSSTFKHSKTNGSIQSNNKPMATTRLQKENNPSKEEYKNLYMLKSVKVSVVNDYKDEIETVPNPRLSVQVDVNSNKKTVIIPKSPNKTNTDDDVRVENLDTIDNKVSENEVYGQETLKSLAENVNNTSHPTVEKGGGMRRNSRVIIRNDISNDDDYESPLQALSSANWEEDPNGVLCPFEIGGNCKDPDCKYLHPKTSTSQ